MNDETKEAILICAEIDETVRQFDRQEIERLRKQIGVLEAEVAAWRNADTWHDLIGYMKEDTDYSHAFEVEEAMAQTDALEPNS